MINQPPYAAKAITIGDKCAGGIYQEGSLLVDRKSGEVVTSTGRGHKRIGDQLIQVTLDVVGASRQKKKYVLLNHDAGKSRTAEQMESQIAYFLKGGKVSSTHPSYPELRAPYVYFSALMHSKSDKLTAWLSRKMPQLG